MNRQEFIDTLEARLGVAVDSLKFVPHQGPEDIMIVSFHVGGVVTNQPSSLLERFFPSDEELPSESRARQLRICLPSYTTSHYTVVNLEHIIMRAGPILRNWPCPGSAYVTGIHTVGFFNSSDCADFRTCTECGRTNAFEPIADGPHPRIDGRITCRQCREHVVNACHICERDLSEETRCIVGNRMVCEDCFNSGNVVECRLCGNNALAYRSRIIDEGSEWDGSYCRSCYSDIYRCENCENRMLIRNVRQTHSGLFCPSCVEELGYTRCPNCGMYTSPEYIDEDDSCPRCEISYIREHDYRPRNLSCLGDFRKEPYLGVELEVEAPGPRNNYAKKVHKEFRPHPFYIKHDGSLENGFEIVTHPCTLTYHKETFPWSEICSMLSQEGAKSHQTTTCGLHVHVDRTGLSQVQELKLGMMVYMLPEFMRAMAKRRESSYARYVRKDSYFAYNKNRDRYEAINFENEHTIEFRMFRGTLRVRTLLARLEMVQLFYNVVREWKIGISKIVTDPQYVTDHLLKYIRNSQKSFPNLYCYLKEDCGYFN